MTIERIVKEKNIVSIYPEGKTKCYTIDINTGRVCGLMGREIQRIQITREAIYSYYRRHDINANKSYFYKTLSQLFDNWCSSTHTGTIKDNIKALQVADSLTNANVHIISDAMDICRLMFIADNLKEYVAYAKRVEAGEQISVVDWIKELKYHKFLKEYNLNPNIVSYDSYIELQSYPRILQNMLHYQYILNHKDSVTNLCRFGYMVCHNSEVRDVEYYVYRIINKYYEWCECLKKKPEKAVNMGREIMETYQTYMLNKEKFDTEKMINNYAQHKKAFEFTYGDYTVVVGSQDTKRHY